MTASLEVALNAITCWRHTANGPLVVGLCGAQGSGKSTLATQLKSRLESAGFSTAILSLDDLYLSRASRADLAQRVHPLFQTRGVPGTHDVALGELILKGLAFPSPPLRSGGGGSPREAVGRSPEALSRACRDGGGNSTVALPRFDKSTDNPFPPVTWPTLTTPVDIILFEGWCVGARLQPEADLTHPVNTLERDEDPAATWRTYANTQLSGPYQTLFSHLDKLILLAAPNFDVIHRWRTQQEHDLRRQNPTATHAMTDDQVARFIQHYQRLTQHILQTMPAYADLTLRLDADRNLIETQLK